MVSAAQSHLDLECVNTVEESSKVLCFLWVSERESLFCGLADGSISCWQQREVEVEEPDPTTEVLRFMRRRRMQSLTRAARAHAGDVTCLLYIPSFQSRPPLLVTASADRTVKLWDPWRHVSRLARDSAMEPEQTIHGHTGMVTGMALHGGDEMTVITGCRDGKVRVLTRVPGREMLLYPWLQVVRVVEVGEWITCLHYSVSANRPEVSELFVGDNDGYVHTFGISLGAKDLGLARSKPRVQVNRVGVQQLWHDRADNYLIVLGFDQSVVITDVLSGAEVFKRVNHRGAPFTGAVWSSRRRELLVTDGAGWFTAFDVSEDAVIRTLRMSDQPLTGAALLRGGDELLVSGVRGLKVYRLNRHRAWAEFPGHKMAVLGLAYDPEEEGGGDAMVYSASADNTVRSWSRSDRAMDRLWTAFESEASAFCFPPPLDAALGFITGHSDGSLLLWSHDSGSAVYLDGHNNTVTAICTVSSKHHTFIVSADFDGVVGAWAVHKTHAPSLHQMFKALEEECLCLAADPLRRLVFAAGNGRVIVAFDVERGFLAVDRFVGHTDAVCSLCLDGNVLFSGSDDGSIRLWDTLSGTALATIQDAHAGPVAVLAIMDGRLVSGGADGRVAVRDYAEADRPVQEFVYPGESITALCHLARAANTQDGEVGEFAKKGILAGTQRGRIVMFPME